MKKLRKKYDKILNKYACTFAGIMGAEWYWVEKNRIIQIADRFFDIENVIFIADNPDLVTYLLYWYDFVLEFHHIGEVKKMTITEYTNKRIEFNEFVGFGNKTTEAFHLSLLKDFAE